jgi:hypothetical protein
MQTPATSMVGAFPFTLMVAFLSSFGIIDDHTTLVVRERRPVESGLSVEAKAFSVEIVLRLGTP